MGEAQPLKVAYTPSALRQIDKILTYIEERNPRGARHVQERIKAMVNMLAEHPLSGHATDEPGQRRMIASPYPYAIFYRVRDDLLIVQRVRHTSRRSVT